MMGFRIKHLSIAELAEIRRSNKADLMDLIHLAECARCKQQFSDSLILRKLMRHSDAIVATSPHLRAHEIDKHHASAYEAAETNPDTFLEVDRHLQECDSCFATFMHVHERLSPSRHLVDRVVKQAAHSSRKHLGVLVLQNAFDSISLALKPAKRTRSSEPFSERTLKDLLRIAQPAKPFNPRLEHDSSEIQDPPGLKASYSTVSYFDESADDDVASYRAFRPITELETLGSLQVENVELVVGRISDPKRVLLVLHAIEIESGKSVAGVEVAEIDAQGSVIAVGKTDTKGEMQIELLQHCERLRVATPTSRDPWEIRVEVKRQFFRTSSALAKPEEEAAPRETRSGETEERKARRKANVEARQVQVDRFRALSPEEQLAWVARDEKYLVYFYQALFPSLTPDLLSRIEPALLEKLDARLKRAKRGPLREASQVLEAYLAARTRKK